MSEILPEIVFSSSDSSTSRKISQRVKSGVLRKIFPRIYTSNLEDTDEAIVSRNLWPILGVLFPGAVVSHRTACEGRPTDSGDFFLTYKYSKNVNLPGIRVHLLKGHGRLETDMELPNQLCMSSKARAFLECLQISRSRSGPPKTLPVKEIEERLDQICRIQGDDELNRLRDEAREVAAALNMNREFERLNGMVSALLRTRPAQELSSPQARATSRGEPYDPQRLELFNLLFTHLRNTPLPTRRERALSDEEARNFAFFESYFSNYIEGTEFEVSEAYDIVMKKKIPEDRPKDAHDILGTYRIVQNQQEMRTVPQSYDEFLRLLKYRHQTVMEGRPENKPGEFKTEANRAGETHFVTPELVKGTLLHGFGLYHAVEAGLARAIFMMFLVSEVHPFIDGNGRVARIMMNSELASAGHNRIIVPTVMRDDNLTVLRALSRGQKPEPLTKFMDHVQKFSSEIILSSYDEAVAYLTARNAFVEPVEDRLWLPNSNRGDD